MTEKKKTPARRNINLQRRAEIGLEKRARTRAHILDTAFILLGRQWGLLTNIDDICKHAKIARGTFYNYFNGMDALFDALSYELNHDFNVAVHAILNEMPSAAERAAAAARYYLERALKDAHWGWAMVNISAAGPIYGAETYELAQKTAQQGMESGEFELSSSEIGRDAQLGIGLASMISFLRTPPSPSREYPLLTARHILRALGVTETRIDEILKMDLAAPEGRVAKPNT